jgi:hypothetical protein
MVSGSISLLCSRFFSPFLHSTGSLSVSQEYLALRDGPRSFTQDFSCPALLRIPLGDRISTCTGLSPDIAGLSIPFHLNPTCHNVVLQPRICRNRRGLGCSPFARHYLGNHCYFLLLGVMRCFSSPRSPPLQDTRSSTVWVAPFGNLRINAYLQLPVAYRSLSRPSSPLRA